jgi:hypothetical protein
MNKKHITFYEYLLLEQEIAGATAAVLPPEEEKEYPFIFIDEADPALIKKKKYPDGSVEIEFPTFVVKEKELEDWVNTNIIVGDNAKLNDSIVKLRRKNLKDIVIGKKVNIADDDIKNIEKLKNAVSTDIFGKRGADITVIFTQHGEPTSENIDTTFIKYKK